MKTKPFVFLAMLATAAFAHSEEQAAPAPTTARIVGEIPDGTPAPAAPQVEFVVPAKDVLETTTHELEDGRTVTIQRIKPIDLPPPPEETAPAPAVNNAAFQQRLANIQAQRQQSTPVSLGVTVYRSASQPPRSLVTYRPVGSSDAITFWSSADFSLLTGVSKFISTDGKTHPLWMMCHSENADNTAAFRARHGLPYQAPQIPSFPEGNATYQIVGTQPAAAVLVPIQSLHDLYNNEFDKLLTAYQGREQARIQRDADLKAHPPEPKDITLNYWRTEKPAPAAEGGDQ